MRNFLVALALGLASIAAPASAVTVDFSFSNDPAWGNVNGTVTGHIDGLTDNGTSAASAVYIDSYPAGLQNAGYPANVFDWVGVTIAENSFTLLNGVIVGGSFQGIAADAGAQLYLNSTCCGAGTNFLNIDGSDHLYVWNQSGLGGLSSSPAAVPEPATWAMMLLGFVGMGVSMRRRKPAMLTQVA